MPKPDFLGIYQYRGLPKEIYYLFFVRLILAMGNFVYPFFVLLLSQKLKLSDKEVGDFMLLVSTTFVPASLIGGKISDIIGRKALIIPSNLIGAGLLIYCVFNGLTMTVAYILVGFAFFNGMAQPANTAMVADLTTPGRRKDAFSLLYIGNNIGFAVGVGTAGLLFANHTKWMFIGNAFALFTGMMLLLLGVKEPFNKNIKDLPISQSENSEIELGDKEKKESGNVLQVLIKRPGLLAFIFIQILYSYVYAQHNYTLSLYLSKLYTNGAKVFGSLMTTNGIVVIMTTTFLISLTKRFSNLYNVGLAAILFGIGFGSIYFIKTIFPFFVSTVLWTFGEILLTTNAIVYISENTPLNHRGRINSIYMIISGTGFAIGPSITGRFIEKYGIIHVWPMVFVLSLVAFFMILILKLFQKKHAIA